MYRLIDYGAQVQDQRRIDAYRRALAAVITPTTTVLDLGAGLGTFSVIACKLGARHVYAVEAADVISVAREIARASGVNDRITFIQARSAGVTLPERVDVIVSDLASALPLFEEHLLVIADARERFLAPGGVLIPEKARLLCAPVVNPAIRERILAPWSAVPEADFGPARTMALNAAHPLVINPEDLGGEPRAWAEIDYHTVQSPHVSGTAEWAIDRPVQAVALWFEHRMHGDVRSGSGPWERESVHATMVLPLLAPLEGNTLTLEIEATLAGGRYITSWHARTDRDPGTRQSTFLSEPRSAALSETASRRFRACERVLARPVAADLVLFDPQSGVYHVLNETGAEVWRLLERSADAAGIAGTIAELFEVDVDRAAADVAVILADLYASGLIEPAEAPLRSPTTDAARDRDCAPST